jgi:hypothetical protein
VTAADLHREPAGAALPRPPSTGFAVLMAVPQIRTVRRDCLSQSRGIAELETMHDYDQRTRH